MQTLDILERRIHSAEELQSIVKTMKALAAVSIRQCDRAARSLDEYNRATEMGLQVVMNGYGQNVRGSPSEPAARCGAIIFGTDQGMCGQFNEHIATYAVGMLGKLSSSPHDPELLGAGARVVSYLEEQGYRISRHLPIPSSVNGIGRLVRDTLIVIDDWRMHAGVDHVYLFYNRRTAGMLYRPHMARLIPANIKRLTRRGKDAWPTRSIPLFTMQREQLLTALIRQHLFVTVYQAFAESMASENASRLAAMQAAETNIRDRLAELKAQYHDQRQSQITGELLDIVSGFETLSQQAYR